MRRWLLVLAVSAVLPTGCGIDYLVKQGAEQVSMLTHRESIAEVLHDPTLPRAERSQLTLALEAKRFAEHDLGLKRSDSYTQLVRLRRDAVSYSVSAAPPDSLEPFTWTFPIVGRVPYKGFFDRHDAERESARLRALGFDTFVGRVPAYSLLGFVPDPLYSPMLASSPFELADTIVHELTHGTVFLSGEADFNEGFAQFVGDKGALLFFAHRFGAGSNELHDAEAMLRDTARYNDVMRGLASELRALYERPITRDEKVRLRVAVFERARARLRATAFETSGFEGIADERMNNATVMAFATYNGANDRFEAVYRRFGGDLRRFVAFFRDRVAKSGDPQRFLDDFLRRAS